MTNYYVGLDIGTDSEYHILKKHGKALWGVRLFGEANKAEERRSFRTARRRLERRNQRIEWLREIFSKEIAKVDPAFFLRVDESKYIESDKKCKKTVLLWADIRCSRTKITATEIITVNSPRFIICAVRSCLRSVPLMCVWYILRRRVRRNVFCSCVREIEKEPFLFRKSSIGRGGRTRLIYSTSGSFRLCSSRR